MYVMGTWMYSSSGRALCCTVSKKKIHSWHQFLFLLSIKSKMSWGNKAQNKIKGSCVWVTGWGQKMPPSVEMFWLIYRVSSALIGNAEPRIAHRPPALLAMEESPTAWSPWGYPRHELLLGLSSSALAQEKLQKINVNYSSRDKK